VSTNFQEFSKITFELNEKGSSPMTPRSTISHPYILIKEQIW